MSIMNHVPEVPKVPATTPAPANVGRIILGFLRDKGGVASPEELHDFLTNDQSIDMEFYELGVIVTDLQERNFCDLITIGVDEGNVPLYTITLTKVGLVYIKFEF